MAKSSNQKLKLLYLMKIFMEKTDESHYLTMPQILQELELYGVKAERKSIYSDIEELNRFGLDIISESMGRACGYYMASREFELAELKLLVDSVQSAKFITSRKSNQLIKKLEALASEHEAKQLHRQVYVSGRIKTNNESIFYNVDKLHSAIGSNVKIRFRYFQWTVEKEKELRRDGAYYCISPWALSWDDENYYLIGYDGDAARIKHYRVDKMMNIELTKDVREGKEHFKQFDMAAYARKTFGMFGGKEETVHIQCANELAGVMIDRFGQEVSMRRVDEEHFEARVNVAVSGQFLGWIMALGDRARIVGPEQVVNRMKEEIQKLVGLYS